jgi:hypothetical protein
MKEKRLPHIFSDAWWQAEADFLLALYTIDR